MTAPISPKATPSTEHDTLIPVTVVSGFLGSGKSTAINHLLRGDHGLRLAVLVNEFGAVGIDGAMLQGDAQFVELDNGCLCCAINDELEQTAIALVARGGIDRIVIETTGLADPLPVAWTFARGPLYDTTRLDAIVTLVDAEHGPSALTRFLEAREQVIRADVVAINKMDSVSDGGRAARASILKLRPEAVILTCTQGALPDALLLGAPRADKNPMRPAVNPSHKHQPSMQTLTFQLPLDPPVDPIRLEDLVETLGAQVFRLKGLVRTCDDIGEYTLVNGVCGRSEIRPLVPRMQPTSSNLVMIGEGLDAVHLEHLCVTHLGAGRMLT